MVVLVLGGNHQEAQGVHDNQLMVGHLVDNLVQDLVERPVCIHWEDPEVGALSCLVQDG